MTGFEGRATAVGFSVSDFIAEGFANGEVFTVEEGESAFVEVAKRFLRADTPEADELGSVFSSSFLISSFGLSSTPCLVSNVDGVGEDSVVVTCGCSFFSSSFFSVKSGEEVVEAAGVVVDEVVGVDLEERPHFDFGFSSSFLSRPLLVEEGIGEAEGEAVVDEVGVVVALEVGVALTPGAHFGLGFSSSFFSVIVVGFVVAGGMLAGGGGVEDVVVVLLGNAHLGVGFVVVVVVSFTVGEEDEEEVVDFIFSVGGSLFSVVEGLFSVVAMVVLVVLGTEFAVVVVVLGFATSAVEVGTESPPFGSEAFVLRMGLGGRASCCTFSLSFQMFIAAALTLTVVVCTFLFFVKIHLSCSNYTQWGRILSRTLNGECGNSMFLLQKEQSNKIFLHLSNSCFQEQKVYCSRLLFVRFRNSEIIVKV